MLTRAFNCSKCKKPFGCAEGESKKPSFSGAKQGLCTSCFSTYHLQLSHRGLMDFLDQSSFQKTDVGYEYTLPINEPVCCRCYHPIDIFDGELAFIAGCGHYICKGCDRQRGPPTGLFSLPPSWKCTVCDVVSDGSTLYPDTLLAAFSSEVKDMHIQRMNERFKQENEVLQAEKARLEAIVAKQGEERDTRAVQKCDDCEVEQPVERLFLCKDCTKAICGFCSFNSHREHSVDKLLGLELVELEKRNDEKFMDQIGGVHDNLKYIHTTIDIAVRKVVAAGKECLAKISTSAQYKDAHIIATTIDKAADKFEQHCEEYFPVARRFATKLTELGEELTEYQK